MGIGTSGNAEVGATLVVSAGVVVEGEACDGGGGLVAWVGRTGTLECTRQLDCVNAA